jgi:hypothetical protein
MDDLAAFIEARLAEDEAMAKAAAADVNRLAGRANWTSEARMVTDAEDPDWAIADLSPFVDDECLARHIACHDPARVLREVAAKRAIAAEHQPRRVGQSLTWCGRCHQVIRDAREDEDPCGPFDWPCPTMRALAAAWSDHPDYRAGWAPGHG